MSATAKFAQYVKKAGTTDYTAMHEFADGLRPGDLVSFDGHGPATAAHSLRQGLSNALISQPIKSLQGSPLNHTAMFTGHNADGMPMLIHNYEQGSAKGIQEVPLHSFTNRTNLKAHRVSGASDEQASAAVARAREFMNSGQSRYSKRNLAGAAPLALAEKARQAFPNSPLNGPIKRVADRVSSLIGEKCDPGSGICSFLPADAYAHGMGREAAVHALTGKNIPWEQAQREISPAMLANSPTMKPAGSYAPLNAAGNGLRGYLGGIASRVGKRLARSPLARI